MGCSSAETAPLLFFYSFDHRQHGFRGIRAVYGEALHGREALGEAPVLRYSIGGVIAINAGPNLVGLIYRT